MPSDLVTQTTQHILDLAPLSTAAVEDLRHAATAAPLLPGGGFHDATDIDSLDGLPGDYLWSEDHLAIRTITFAFDPTTVGRAGSYTIKTGTLVFEQGSFQCFPSGAGTNVALLFLQPTGGPQRIFVIAGAFIDPANTITIMLLVDFNIAGQIIPRFSAVRLP